MTGGFEVRYSDAARDDLLRFFDFLLQRARTVEDFDAAQLVIDIITTQVASQLSHSPFIFRKAGESPFLRELIIPFRSAGYVALYEIENGTAINILAVRHQIEDDYH